MPTRVHPFPGYRWFPGTQNTTRTPPMYSIASRSNPHNAIDTDHNEPIQTICISTISTTINPHDTIGIVPPFKWAHTIILPYGHVPNDEPEWAICVLTVSSRSNPHNTIGNFIPWIKYAHTIIASYGHSLDHEPVQVIHMYTVPSGSECHNAIRMILMSQYKIFTYPLSQ